MNRKIKLLQVTQCDVGVSLHSKAHTTVTAMAHAHSAVSQLVSFVIHNPYNMSLYLLPALSSMPFAAVYSLR